ncbi:MAG TPA: hypothetical protein VLF94_04230 [Chlamydiales bacterium]|nr:hypothetical protein [Chlamydiales bacterium]
MKKKKILGIALIVVGAIMLLFSHYIAEQVAEGRMRISSAQSTLNTTNRVFDQTQYTKPVGGLFTGGAQQRINAGTAEADQYADLAQKLQIAGIVLIIVGVGVLFLGKKKSV